MFSFVKLQNPPTTALTHSIVIPWKAGWLPVHYSAKSNLTGAWLSCPLPAKQNPPQIWQICHLQVEFNNAVKENNTHSLRHGAKKSNIEKNQNPRIIPCEYYAEIISNIKVSLQFLCNVITPKMTLTGCCRIGSAPRWKCLINLYSFNNPQMTSTGWCWSPRKGSLTLTTLMLLMLT